MKTSLLIFFIGCSLSVHCQIPSDTLKKIWVTIGYTGWSTAIFHQNGSGGFGFNLSADYLKNNNYWKIRLIRAKEDWNNYLPDENHYDIGLLYGRITKTKLIRLSISGGLGVFGGIKRRSHIHDNYFEKDQILTPAIPFEVELGLVPLRYLGIGISGFANLNLKSTMIGGMIKLEVGRMR